MFVKSVIIYYNMRVMGEGVKFSEKENGMDNGASSYRRFLSGDESALIEIISIYRPGLQNYINSFVRNISVAEDLTEDTFVKLLIKKPRDRSEASFKTWLYTIGRNIAIDWLRKNPKGREIPFDDAIEAEAGESSLEENYYADEISMAVRQALEEIKPEYKQVLWLFYFEEFSVPDIAKIIRKSKNNTSVLLHRAKAALKKQLEKENFDYEI